MAEEMFRAPVNRAMRTLDRSFFQKHVQISAARVLKNQDISRCRSELQKSQDALALPHLPMVRDYPVEDGKPGQKCVLLRPELHEDASRWPWSPTVDKLQRDQVISVAPFDLHLDYDYWTYHEIASAVLPEPDDKEGEIPSGFTLVGHVAHLNLREQYLPYKGIIGEILLDKNAAVRTVINKIDDVGEESEYRTFNYELLAGEDDMNVTVIAGDCTFKFNYAKVYYNSRLNTEHGRMVGLFKPGEAVCDVMAGIGPFAVPAGKRKVFVWANDLNPDSHSSLQTAIKQNKVSDYVQSFNEDGHTFIRSAASELLRAEYAVTTSAKPASRTASRQKDAPAPVTQTVRRPRFFSHYVMNLPASATTFLPDFIGLYSAGDRKQLPSDFRLPMIHTYCFSTKSDDNVREGIEICEEISRQIGYTITPQTPETTIWDVRDVAPKKRMFCASFRLPEEVAFRDRSA